MQISSNILSKYEQWYDAQVVEIISGVHSSPTFYQLAIGITRTSTSSHDHYDQLQSLYVLPPPLWYY